MRSDASPRSLFGSGQGRLPHECLEHLMRGPARRLVSAFLVAAMAAALLPSGALGRGSVERPRGSSPRVAQAGKADARAPYVDGEVIVRFRAGVSADKAKSAHERIGSARQRRFSIVKGLEVAKLKTGVSVKDAIESYDEMPEVLYAQPNYIKRASVLPTPNDSRFTELWGLHNTGQDGGTTDADIDAPEAWAIETGSSDVIVAVVDSGVDYRHPELADNMWTNPGEIAGNGIDDDHNGYVDDVHGWDAVGNDGDPMDDHGHGTHCAGTIGGASNNATGVAGVNQDVSIMAVKFLDASGSGDTVDELEAFQYIKTAGAHVTSNSWGGWYQFDQAEYDGIAALGTLFVAAAGNEGSNIENPSPYDSTAYCYPAAYDLPNILSVGASDRDDQPAEFSNRGVVSVDVFAPGVEILSTIPGRSELAKAAGAVENAIFSEDFTDLDYWESWDYQYEPWVLSSTTYRSAPSAAAFDGYENGEASYLEMVEEIDGTMVPVGPAINLAGKDFPGLRVWWNHDLEPDYDFGVVYVYDLSASEYTFIDEVTGDSAGAWVEHLYDLKPFAGQSDIYLCLGIEADEDINGDAGVWADDVEVFDLDSAVPGQSPWLIPEPDWSAAYDTWNGTSMATPHVAGLAGLLLARNAGLTAAELKTAIMSTVDAKAALSGLCVTGGRINAANALASVAVNGRPVAVDDPGAGEYAGTEDTPLVVAAPGVLDNDSDPEATALTAVAASDPPHGSVSLSTNGGFTYTPDQNWFGTDTFTYRASDGTLTSLPATVTVVIAPAQDAPVAVADAYSVNQDATLTVAARGVLINDTDADPGQTATLTAALVTGPENGTLALSANGAFTYRADAGYGGTDSFTYRASDGTSDSPPASVTITVKKNTAIAVTSASTVLSSYGATYRFTGKLAAGGTGLSGKTVILQAYSSGAYRDTSAKAVTAADGTFSIPVVPRDRTYYRVRFAGDTTNVGSVSTYRVVTPRAWVGNPVAPSVVYSTRYYTVAGYMKPRHSAGSYPVRIYRWRYEGGAWKSYGYVWAKAYDYSTYTKYARAVRLPYKGWWRLRAYAPADSLHAAAWSSGYDTVLVK